MVGNEKMLSRNVIVRESYRNWKTGTSKPVLFGFVLGIVIVLGIILQVRTLAVVIENAEIYHNSGASTQVLDAKDAVDANICDKLGNIDNIKSAGAIKTTDIKITPSSLPNGSIPLFYISPNFIAGLSLVSYDAKTPGVLLSETVQKRLGKTAGEYFMDTGGSRIYIRGVYQYPDDGRQAGLGYAILSLPPNNYAENFDTCLADIWPQNRNLNSALWLPLVGSSSDSNSSTNNVTSSQKVHLSQLNSKLGETYTQYDSYLDSLLPLTSFLVLIIALLFGFISMRVRRLEVASNIHAGLKKLDIIFITIFDAFPAVIFSSLLSLPVLLVVSQNILYETAVLVPYLKILLGSCVGFISGCVFAVILTREQHLFKYFKNR
ncbi:MAG: hypothetical protein LBI63_05115 [Candidatus Ancillula sp.]|nr:hypothetical protein [Candidatus Ancillula sp.]